MKRLLFCFYLLLALLIISCAPKQRTEVDSIGISETEIAAASEQNLQETFPHDLPEMKATILEKEDTPAETGPQDLEAAATSEDANADAPVMADDEDVSEATPQTSVSGAASTDLTEETDVAAAETVSEENEEEVQEDQDEESSDTSGAGTPEEAAAAEIDPNSYKIGSGDILEITTWKEPDFTKTLSVRIDGKITFPLLDDIRAGGLTTLQLKKKIEDGLKDYIETPLVTVTVKGSQSQKFYILGEVSKTGEYELVKNLTILQAFALAGGFTEWASKKEIILIRHEDGKEKIMRINYKNIARGRDFSQNIRIKANDTIIVP